MPGPPSGGAAAGASARGGRHYLLYARQNWRDMRFLLGGLTVVYLALGVWEGVQRHSLALAVQGSGIAVLPPLMMLAVYAYTRMCWVEIGDEGLQVHFPIRRATVAYTEVEKARLDTLKNVFERPEYRRMASGTVKRLYGERALCVRLRGDEDLPAELRRRLGPRTVLDRELVLAITDADVAYGELKQRLLTRRQRPVDEAGDATPRRRRGRRGRRR